MTRYTPAFGTSPTPFVFSVKLAEGNYNVTVTLGDLSRPSITTVKAELRRLMLEKVRTVPGQFATWDVYGQHSHSQDRHRRGSQTERPRKGHGICRLG